MSDLKPQAREDLFRDLYIDARYHTIRATHHQVAAAWLNGISALLASAAALGFVTSLVGDSAGTGIASAAVGLAGACLAALNAAADPAKGGADHRIKARAYEQLRRELVRLDEADAAGLEAIATRREDVEEDCEPFFASIIEAKNLLTRELRLTPDQLVPISRWQRILGVWFRLKGLNVNPPRPKDHEPQTPEKQATK